MFSHIEHTERSETAVRFLAVAEGTPGNAHGGAVISALDTCIHSTPAMARLVSVSPTQTTVGFTASLKVNYRKIVPLGKTLLIRCALRESVPSASDKPNTNRTMTHSMTARLLSTDGLTEYDSAEVLVISAPNLQQSAL
jgi:acyl-coenzyme A thioesterase PaaI-like protein